MSVYRIELMHNLPGLFDHGQLIVPHRNRSRLKRCNIRCLTDGIGKKAHRNAEMENTEKNKIILTGDRPTGRLHVGHYVGSLVRRIELQNSGEYEKTYIMIADAQAHCNAVPSCLLFPIPDTDVEIHIVRISNLKWLCFFLVNDVSQLFRNLFLSQNRKIQVPGPEASDRESPAPSCPYIVIKTEYLEQTVTFE